jgi:hypothetical protein
MKLDNDYHHRVCSWCNTIQVETHNWNLEQVTQNSSGAEIRTYQCHSCGQRKAEGNEGLRGDFTSDGILDNDDVEALLWGILFPGSYEVAGEADFNKDGFVDEKDVEQLLWYTLFPEVYPLAI